MGDSLQKAAMTISDPRWRTLFNTQLPPDQEKQYQAWAQAAGKQGDQQDYDMRGAWAAAGGEMPLGGGHFTDKFKKPNHPTFSAESQYASPIFPGGTWGANSYQPPLGGGMMSRPELEQYFLKHEQGWALRSPKKRKGE